MTQEICPYCECPIPKKYKYHLDDLDVSTLLKIWQAVIEQKENKINVSDIGLTQSERLRLTQLRFHALVAKYKTLQGTHVGNMWLITKRGGDFLKGDINVPSYVITWRNKVIDHSEEKKKKKDFKMLDDFRSTYEIMQGMLINKPLVSQRALSF